MNVVIYKKDRIDYILNGLCNFWGCNMDYLTRRAHNNPRLRDQKQIAIYLLYYVADCSLKDICGALRYKDGTENSLHMYRESIGARLSKDYYGSKKLKLEYQQILKHLQL